VRSEPERRYFSARKAYMADCQAEGSEWGEGRVCVFIAMGIHARMGREVNPRRG
jgi:hypothetical protein